MKGFHILFLFSLVLVAWQSSFAVQPRSVYVPEGSIVLNPMGAASENGTTVLKAKPYQSASVTIDRVKVNSCVRYNFGANVSGTLRLQYHQISATNHGPACVGNYCGVDPNLVVFAGRYGRGGLSWKRLNTFANSTLNEYKRVSVRLTTGTDFVMLCRGDGPFSSLMSALRIRSVDLEMQPPIANGCYYRQDWASKILPGDIGRPGAEVFNANNIFWPIEQGLSGTQASSSRYINGIERLSIARVPYDRSVAMQSLAPRGEVQNWNFYTRNYENNGGTEQIRAEMEMFLPPSMEWGNDQKLALGVWGGEVGCLSGGCPTGSQTGFSIRMNHARTTGIKLYVYNLNRESEHGIVSPGGGHIPTGRWVKFTMYASLNRIGREDGKAYLYMDGRLATSMTGLKFRDANNNWKFRGLLVHDMWGGAEESPIRFSPRNQKYWYRNYSVSSQVCN